MTKTKLNILPVPTFNRLGVNFIEREAAFDEENISVPDGAESQTIQFVETDCKTKASIGKNAKLKLVQIFTDSCASVLKASVADDAQFELIQLYIGGDNASEIITELSGYKSAFTAEIGYDLGADESLDLNLDVSHYGRRSTSDITANGVMRGNAQKTFKGTIDFKNGASGAKGSEKEDVILMSGAVVNRTVPVILCAEEDVEGSHGATIGRIDEQHIYYMSSRGIPEEKICEMITRARLDRIIKMIGDKDAQERICGILGRGDEDDE